MRSPFISEPSIPVTADLPQSTGQQSSTTGDGIEAVNSDSPPSPGSSTGVAVGGAVGGVIVGLLVGVSVIALCVALVIGKRGKLRSEAKHGRDATAMENAMYEGGKTGLMEYNDVETGVWDPGEQTPFMCKAIALSLWIS